MLVFHQNHLVHNNRTSVVGRFDGNRLILSAARTGKKDHFCRRTGRQIASGRLNAGVVHSVVDVKTPSVRIFNQIASDFAHRMQLNAQLLSVG
jgi:hypothetical protein